MQRLTTIDFSTDAKTLARRLIGTSLVRQLSDGTQLMGTIVETEAYLGIHDRAAHSYGGRRTPRNESMYAKAGTGYVYLIYGMYHCVNVVCGDVDEPTAVLIRALEPTHGLKAMALNRPKARRERDLCSGPGKLCQALQINREFDGIDLSVHEELFIAQLDSHPDQYRDIITAPRIGIDYAEDWAEKPLRYCLKNNPNVSVKPTIPRHRYT